MDKQKSIYQEWFPKRILNGNDPFALLILNQPLGKDGTEFLKKTLPSAIFKTAVDGGGNELYKVCKFDDSFLPDLVCGDFDSITNEALEFFKKKGVKISHTPDQDETDFTKALRLTSEHIINNRLKVSAVVALVRNGNRLDQIMANLHSLYLTTELFSVPVFLLGGGAITCLLTEGSHKIYIPNDFLECHVGLFPLANECTDVTTTGLKWNLDHDQMSFKNLISTCNKFDGSGEVTVVTNTELILTIATRSDED